MAHPLPELSERSQQEVFTILTGHPVFISFGIKLAIIQPDSSLYGCPGQDFLLCEVDAVPDHGEVELRVQVHVVALQQDLLVQKSLPVEDNV